MSGSITGFITGGMTSNHCFVAGTVVITVAGKKAIEYIREGDLVLSEDPETGDVTYKKVLETYINETTELIHLNIDGEEIVTTPAHPFYVKDKGFIQAGDLLEGSILVDSEGNELHLKIKRWEHLQSPVPVYNFAVENYHTYFVGNNEVLVHNNCGVNNDSEDIKKVYNSIKEDPHYPAGFEALRNGTTNNRINNYYLHEQLKLIESGNWTKVYKDGLLNGERVSLHYFKSKSGKIFNLKIKGGWSN